MLDLHNNNLSNIVLLFVTVYHRSYNLLERHLIIGKTNFFGISYQKHRWCSSTKANGAVVSSSLGG